MMHWDVSFPGTALIGGILGCLVAAVAWWRRSRMKQEWRSDEPRIDDEAIDTILTRGSLEVPDAEPPLDLDRIAEEEERFWDSESWDRAEEY